MIKQTETINTLMNTSVTLMSQVDLRVALWNANGILNLELGIFLGANKIDVMMISGTHATDKTFINIEGYFVVFANHPRNEAFGGSALLIKNSLNYCVAPSITSDAIQAAVVEIQFTRETVVVGAVYCRPRFNLKEADFDGLLNNFGNKFIVGGDFNAKHTVWGSRLCTPKGRQLVRSINKKSISILSGGSPTYWPTDPNKLPDLIDFYLYKGLNTNLFSIANSTEMSSDHTPVMLTYCAALPARSVPKTVNYNKYSIKKI